MSERLHPGDVDAIARRVAELLAGNAPPRPRLVDAAELAELLDVSRAYIYEHAPELGAVRLGDGKRGRLRFDVDAARAAVTRDHATEPSAPAPRRTTTRPQRPTTGHVLRTRKDTS